MEDLRAYLIWEVPILKSIARHYRKNLGLEIEESVRYAVITHAEDMRLYYEKKYLPQINELK